MAFSSRRAVALISLLFLVSGCNEPVGPVDAPGSNPPAVQPPDESPPVVPVASITDIYVADADGSSVVRLAEGQSPAWSPDGKQIAFSTDGAIYLMEADGSNVVRRTEAGMGTAPAWSPDGRAIAFSSLQGGDNGIYLMRVDAVGSPATFVGHPRGFNDHPAWSPAGGKIAFVSDWAQFDFVYDLYVMNSDGSEITPLLRGPVHSRGGERFYFQPAWSPDGQRLAIVVCGYSWQNCYPQSSVAVLNADGSGLQVLSHSYGYAKPTWSPDGAWLAFGASGGISIVSTSGGGAKLLIPGGTDPAWSPDGTKIAFVSRRDE